MTRTDEYLLYVERTKSVRTTVTCSRFLGSVPHADAGRVLWEDEGKYDQRRTKEEAGQPRREPGYAGERGLTQIDGVDEPALRSGMSERVGERSQEPAQDHEDGVAPPLGRSDEAGAGAVARHGGASAEEEATCASPLLDLPSW